MADPLLPFAIYDLKGGGRALLIEPDFLATLSPANRLPHRNLTFGEQTLVIVASGQGAAVEVVSRFRIRRSRPRALSFASALGDSPDAAWVSATDAIYIEELGIVLPLVQEGVPTTTKALALGRALSGGVSIPIDEPDRLLKAVTWLTEKDVESLLSSANLTAKQLHRADNGIAKQQSGPSARQTSTFELVGRPALSAFFNDHVIDIVNKPERYAKLGIGFPGSVILEGPTGCGKTYAVEQLVSFLGWPSFHIDASSVASPYIHDTSKKIAEVFSEAIKVAPSVVVIDEMDAFLADRDVGSGHHRVEEVAEFLRRIPEAIANKVLVIGMTNKIDMIDDAILRRGRFDHIIRVDPASAAEVLVLIRKLLDPIPNEVSDLGELASSLAGRPLSDVAFVVREAARLAARADKDSVGDAEIAEALRKTKPRSEDETQRIGF